MVPCPTHRPRAAASARRRRPGRPSPTPPWSFSWSTVSTGVSVRDVAERADVSTTTLFAHFPSKEALVFDREADVDAALAAAVRERPEGQGVVEALRTHALESWLPIMTDPRRERVHGASSWWATRLTRTRATRTARAATGPSRRPPTHRPSRAGLRSARTTSCPCPGPGCAGRANGSGAGAPSGSTRPAGVDLWCCCWTGTTGCTCIRPPPRSTRPSRAVRCRRSRWSSCPPRTARPSSAAGPVCGRRCGTSCCPSWRSAMCRPTRPGSWWRDRVWAD
ncbi:hypothetical protein STENM223S_11390 [Streptomyces tendae]